MKIWLKKAGILFSVTAACAAITGITPFFPEIAVERGIPEWSIGFIFAACPFASLLTSLRLSILLEKLGRKTVMLVGVFLLAVSNFIMALVWFSDEYMAIFESVSSRVLAGVGCAFSMTSAYAAATSDFTEEAAKMIAMIEIFCGLGLILGPAFASTFYGLVGFLYCCIIVGSFILISLPALYFILDNSRSYVIVNEGGRVKLRSILLKPVRFK
jgi:MFS family permease